MQPWKKASKGLAAALFAATAIQAAPVARQVREGTLEVLVSDDFASSTSRIHHVLTIAEGERISLRFEGEDRRSPPRRRPFHGRSLLRRERAASSARHDQRRGGDDRRLDARPQEIDEPRRKLTWTLPVPFR